MDKFKKTNSVAMKAITQGWNFMRILRLILGIAILVQGIVAKDATAIVLGVVFGGMAVANIGCCGTTGCEVKHVTPIKNKSKNINYEELDPVK